MSRTKNVTAAFGITHIKYALWPPYNERAPSSAMTSRNVYKRLVYNLAIDEWLPDSCPQHLYEVRPSGETRDI